MDTKTPISSTEKLKAGSLVTYDKEPNQVFIYKPLGTACYLYRNEDDLKAGKHAYAPTSSSKKIRPYYGVKEDDKSPIKLPGSQPKTTTQEIKQESVQPINLINRFDAEADMDGMLYISFYHY